MRSGKEHWLQGRSDAVSAKGKGILKTFWLTPQVDRAYSANSGETDEDEDILVVDSAGRLANQLLKREREVEWVSELMRDAIRDIVGARATKKGKIMKGLDSLPGHRSKNRTPLDEVVDVIKMPEFDSKIADREAQAFAVKIPDNVSRLIREYVSIVSGTLRETESLSASPIRAEIATKWKSSKTRPRPRKSIGITMRRPPISPSHKSTFLPDRGGV